MNQDLSFLEAYFNNANWPATIFLIIAITLLFVYMLRRDKKTKLKTATIATKQDDLSAALDKMSDAVELLINNNTNKVNLMMTESIIKVTLLSSKHKIKDEIRRIFKQNHRESAQRQPFIKQSIANVTLSTFENDIKTLSMLYYKSKKLSEFLININNEAFFGKLIKLVFATGGDTEKDFDDIMMFIDSEFDKFIILANKYYNKL